MSTQGLRYLGAILTLFGLLNACGPPQPTASPSAGASATPRRLPTVNPTPALEIEFSDLVIRADPHEPGLWQVFGLLRNDSSIPLADMAIQVTIEYAVDDPPIAIVVPPLLARLGPGEESPFVGVIEHDEEPSGARAALLEYTQIDLERAQLDLQILDIVSEGNHTLLLGEVGNESRREVEIAGLSAWALDSSGELIVAAPALIYPQSLPAEGHAPFLARISGTLDEPEWIVSVDAVRAEPTEEMNIPIVNGPFLRADSQGAPFLVGELRNDSRSAASLSLILSIRRSDRLLALAELHPPLPLQAGEALAFSVGEFYGLETRIPTALADEEDLDIQTYIHAGPALPEARVPLSLQIEGIETVGSSIFFRGTMEGPGEAALRRPTVFATLRSTGGELLTAGWATPAEQLEAGEVLPFVLPLRLPQGVEPSAAEFDLRGFALLIDD